MDFMAWQSEEALSKLKILITNVTDAKKRSKLEDL